MPSRTLFVGRLFLLLALVALLSGGPAEATGLPPPSPQVARSSSSGWTDLAVAAFGGFAAPGRPMNFEIDFANDGNLPANGVMVQDTLPANMTYSSTYWVWCSGCSAAANTPSSVSSSQVTYSLGTLAPQAAGKIEFIVQISPTAIVGSTLTNLAQIADDPSSGPEQNLANDTSTATVQVAAGPPPTVDLSMTDQIPSDFAQGGQGAIMVILTNQGTATAPNTRVTATLPTGVSYVSNTVGAFMSNGPSLPASVSGNQVVLSVGDVPSRGGETFVLTLQVAPSVAVGTSLAISLVASSDTTDVNPANNALNDTIDVLQPFASLSLTPTVPAGGGLCVGPCNPTTVGPGTDATFPIQVQNIETLNLPNLTITQTLPSFVTVESVQLVPNPSTSTPITPTVNGNQVTFSFGNVAAGTSFIILPTYHVDPAAPVGTTMTITTSASASVTPNLSATPLSTSFQVIAPSADLHAQISPLVGAAPTPSFAPGGEVYYMLWVGSGGPTEALGVTMVASLPPGATYVGTGESNCNSNLCSAAQLTPVINGNQVSFNLGNLPPQAGDWIDIGVRLDPSLTSGAALTTTLQVSSATADPDPSSNSASSTTTLQTPTFDLNSGIGCAPTCPVLTTTGAGGSFGQMIVNTGTVAAYNVEVTQTFPSGTWPLPFVNLQTMDEQGLPSDTNLAPLVTGSQAIYKLGTIPANGQVNFISSFQFDPSLAPGTQLTLTITVSSSPADDNPSDNSATITYQIEGVTPTSTPTSSPLPSATPTLTPTLTPTATLTVTPTATLTPTATITLTATITPTITLTPAPAPDLVAGPMSFTPTTVSSGGRFLVGVSTRNQGDAAAGPSLTRFYLVDTPYGKGGPFPLFGSISVPALSAGQTWNAWTAVTVPASTAPGSYHVAACADVTNAVAEQSETNNCFVVGKPLTVVGPTTATPSATSTPTPLSS